MATPRERIERIIQARTPRQVEFKARQDLYRRNVLVFDPIIVKASYDKEIPEDLELQKYVSPLLKENLDFQQKAFTIVGDVTTIWDTIKSTIASEYYNVSKRSKTTKRLTANFINNIKINDLFLANYLIQTFIQISSSNYAQMAAEAQKDLFESFEPLRRTYGKRNTV